MKREDSFTSSPVSAASAPEPSTGGNCPAAESVSVRWVMSQRRRGGCRGHILRNQASLQQPGSRDSGSSGAQLLILTNKNGFSCCVSSRRSGW
ncbi:unnamed protein product [Pleuronectes platessa]|uniref:Uncharacterized protein n=1 Tax=Pleuronectes platessa TaxID=8262 RepID=A0A9N7YUL0_PLEPL|nr:unnamed protein product [Pleuronectes platessa]